MSKPVVIVHIEGGMVSHVLTSTEDVDVVVVDHDTDNVDSDALRSLPGAEDEWVSAGIHEPDQVDGKLAGDILESLR